MRREKFILYTVPFSMDVVIGLITISIPLFAINLGANPLILGGLGFTGGLLYVLLSPLFGRLSDHIGCKYLLFLGCLVYFSSSLALSFSSKVYQLFIFMAFVGISGAMFWPSLEVLVAQMGTADFLPKRVSLFNISWCMGAAVGPLIGGMIFQVGARFPFYLASLLSLLMSLLIAGELFKDKGEKVFDDPEENFLKENPSGKHSISNLSQEKTSSYLYVAWMANFANYFSVGTLRYLFPKLSVQLGIQPSILGILFGIIALFQTLTFYLLGKTIRWHYKLMPLIFLQLLGAFGLFLVFFTSSSLIFLLAFMFIGIAGGMTYFSSIFYSLNDCKNRGTKSGIHEAVLGSGALFGPLVGGVFAQAYSLRIPYLLAIFVTSAAIIGEVLLVGRRK